MAAVSPRQILTNHTLIIAGGKGDPDLDWIADAAKHRGLKHIFCHCNSASPTSIDWDLQSNSLRLDGELIDPENASIYIRYSMLDNYGEQSREDAFTLVEHWYQAVRGWAMANDRVGLLNRDAHVLGINKPYNLLLAQQAGFKIPETRVINQLGSADIAGPSEKIAKVVGDGESTKLLPDAISANVDDRVFAARPWIVQNKLDYPELRVFRVGDWLFGFEMTSDQLDHRLDDNLKLAYKDMPDELVRPMVDFTNALKLDYCAADFKTCQKTGEYVFLEVNTAPTFSGYDAKVNGELSDAIILRLTELSRALQL